MRKQNKLHLSILLTCLLFGGFSCKKYEEGPLISLKTKDNRILGVWDLEYLFINNIDSTEAVKSQLCYGVLDFYKVSREYHFGDWNSRPMSIDCKPCKGQWSLTKDKKSLVIRNLLIDSCSFKSVGPFLGGYFIKWEIRRLTCDQMWLANNFNGLNCWAHFKKK